MSTEADHLARRVYDHMMQHDYCSQWLGIEPLSIRAGYCQLRMTVRREMLNGFGILHGGIAFTFADSAFAFASNSYGRVAVSINGHMAYAKSAKAGDVLTAEAQALYVGHKKADFDVTIRLEATHEPLYHFRGTVYRTERAVLEEKA